MQSQSKEEEIMPQSSHFHWIIEPAENGKKYGLALGNMLFAQNADILRENGIKAVITVMGEAELKLPADIKHFRILIADDPSENIKCFFDSASKFIQAEIKEHNVLVHCKAGVSRSATIVASYLMNSMKLSANDAVSLLKEKRSIVYPNKGFMKQLRIYDRELAQRREKEVKCCIY